MTTIEKNVMANVALIYTLRKLLSRTMVELYAFAASLWLLGKLVWVSRIFENLSAVGLNHALQFTAFAVLHTTLVVQLTLAVCTVAALSLLLDAARVLTPRAFAA